jgi:phenylalanyl-tRNA synthetase beta chain
MPTIEISRKDLCSLIGKNLNVKEIEELLHFAKATLESSEGDVLRVEAGDVNRPDLWSSEGIARAIKGQLGRETGVPKFRVEHSDFVVRNKGVAARPLIGCTVVKNLKLNDEAIKQLVQLQEKLCESFGLRRKEAALGIYDFDRIKWPVSYVAVKPEGVKFVPLDMNEALTPKQILQRHEKGRQYAHLLADAREYPLIIDSANEVLSMPPVINSNFTGKVTEKTKNVFVEVTGFSYRFILPVLNIMTAALAERGGRIFSVRIEGREKIATPNLEAKIARLDADYCNRIIGTDLSIKEICRLLEKARFNTKILQNSVEVAYMPYRQDIMDVRDIVEDVAVAYGYNNLKPQETKIPTTGKAADFVSLREKITELLVGLNMQETATFTLTNKDALFKRMNIKEEQNAVIEVSNPVSANYSCIRNSLLPSALEFLSQNTKKEFPQRIFEIGECYSIQEQKTKNNMLAALTHKNANFTEIKQVLDYLAGNLGVQHKILAISHESFIEGRTGRIIIDGKNAGIIGEINPKVLSAWNIEMPVAVLELQLDIIPKK